jgi:hypothetical protein
MMPRGSEKGTLRLYQSMVPLHIGPTLGMVKLARLSTPMLVTRPADRRQRQPLAALSPARSRGAVRSEGDPSLKPSAAASSPHAASPVRIATPESFSTIGSRAASAFRQGRYPEIAGYRLLFPAALS